MRSVPTLERKVLGQFHSNAEEQEKKTIEEFSPNDIVEDTTGNTPRTIKNDSQTKRTSFTEMIAVMVGMKPREKEEVVPMTEKSKTFGTVSAKTTRREPKQLLQPGKGDGKKATAAVKQGRDYRQKARETYQKGYAGNEATVRHREQ